MRKTAKITGVGMFVPPKTVSNKDLEPMLDISDEWVRQRTGIEARRWAEGASTSSLAIAAAREALEHAGCEAITLDLIIVATQSPDFQVPGTSALVQAALGLHDTPALDIRTQCTGFLYAFQLAKAMIESGVYRRILIVGAEAQSPLLDWTPRGRNFSILFGDGAGAFVVEARDEDLGCGQFILHAQGAFANRLCHKKPGTGDGAWLSADDIESGRIFPYMDGKFVFKHAVERLLEVIPAALKLNQVDVDAIDHFIFHQANLRINERVGDTLKLPREKIYSNIQSYGNCSGASIPILFTEKVRDGTIKRGERILFAAFGAGFTWAAGVVVF